MALGQGVGDKAEPQQLMNRCDLTRREFQDAEWIEWAQGLYVPVSVILDDTPQGCSVVESSLHPHDAGRAWRVFMTDITLGSWPDLVRRGRAMVLACQALLDRIGDELVLGTPPRLTMTRRERELEPEVVTLTYRTQAGFKRVKNMVSSAPAKVEPGGLEEGWWSAVTGASPLEGMAALQQRFDPVQVDEFWSSLFAQFADRHQLQCSGDADLFLAMGAATCSRRAFEASSMDELLARLTAERFVLGEELVTLIESAA